jgi:Fe-S cluster assembly protein SufD
MDTGGNNMSLQTILPIGRDSVEALSKKKNEPAWLVELRLKALELAGLLDLPKLEKMNIERWNIDAYGEYIASERVSSLDELPQIKDYVQSQHADASVLVQRNSNNVYASLPDRLAKQGVIFTDLETAARENSNLVQKYLTAAVKKDENRLTALHTALWNGGVFLYVPKNVEVDIPLQALFLSDNDEAAFSPHVLIIAETGSRLTYVENYVSAGANEKPLVHNGVAEVFIKPGAHVQFASIHNLGISTTDLSVRRAIVENDGRIDWVIGEMNNGDCASETLSVLKGNGSSSDCKMICVGTNDQKLHITTRAVHFGKSSDSNMITRAVMRDNATAIINGITKIEKGATNANGEQTEKVLMLSPTARGDANPMLLIDEDEVTAGHAASVGQVDKNQMYYLMSRGISKENAQRLIIYGFLKPVVSEVPISNVEKELQSLVERKLEK